MTVGNVTCTRCQKAYPSSSGEQSTCPSCGWVNVRAGILTDINPVVKFLLLAGLILIVLVAVGYGIDIYRAG
jgi:hypothetical protein